MKKLIIGLVWAVMAVFGLGSCSEEAFDVDSVNKQTILVFLPWSGGTNSIGLTKYLSNNIDSICAGIVDKKGLNNTRVMVFFSENVNSSTLYDLEYDAANKTVNRIPVKSYEGTVYNSAEGFASILNEVKQDAEALNYALIIGGHGCGWSYADDWSDYPNNAKPSYRAVDGILAKSKKGSNNFGFSSAASSFNSLADNFSGIQFGEDANHPLTRFFGSVSRKENAMDVTTLAEAIQLSGIKMQYILFDACYMGNVETAYELKDVTNYLISSSSEILAAGVPYRLMWSYLNSATPNYSSFVNGVVNFYKTYDPYCNMAAIDCREIDNLASVMKDINSKYTLDASIPLDSIQPLDGFSPHLSYDLGVYVDSLAPSGYMKEQFTNQLKKTIKVAAHTDEVITALGLYKDNTIKVKNYCGLSISDPSQHPVALRGKEKTGWWKATH